MVRAAKIKYGYVERAAFSGQVFMKSRETIKGVSQRALIARGREWDFFFAKHPVAAAVGGGYWYNFEVSRVRPEVRPRFRRSLYYTQYYNATSPVFYDLAFEM